jgi:hypothetical protein
MHELAVGNRVTWFDPESGAELKGTIKLLTKNTARVILPSFEVVKVDRDDLTLVPVVEKPLEPEYLHDFNAGEWVSVEDISPIAAVVSSVGYKSVVLKDSAGKELLFSTDPGGAVREIDRLTKIEPPKYEVGDRVRYHGEEWSIGYRGFNRYGDGKLAFGYGLTNANRAISNSVPEFILFPVTGEIPTESVSIESDNPGLTDEEKSRLDKLAKANFHLNFSETFLDLADLTLEPALQQRTKLDIAHVQTLEDALDEVENLEAIDVFTDGENFWPWDGYHRIHAYKNKGRSEIPARVKPGTLREAVLASTAANAKQLALPRTRADKRKAVETLLADPEWGQWSDREIGKQARVDHKTVAAIRRAMSVGNSPETEPKPVERKFTNKHGGTSTIKVAPRPVAVLDPAPEPDPTPLPPAPIIEVKVEEVIIGFLSNIDRMTKEQLKPVLERLVKRLGQLEEECQSGISRKAS